MVYIPTPIGTPSIPASLLIVGDEPDVLKALKYRTQINQYGQVFLNLIAQYMTGFSTNIDELVMPAPEGDEERALEELYDQSKGLATDLQAVTDAILLAISEDLVSDPVAWDTQAFITAVSEAILGEISESDDTVAEFRTLLRSIIDLALLNSSYDILGSEEVLINNAVDSFIARSKSELDTKMNRVDRQTINELDLDGVLDSDIGAEIIARALIDKGRAYLEVEYKGEELRIEWTNEAFDRAIKRVQTKISAGQLIPTDLLRLQPALYDMLADLAKRRFLDRNTFINTYPSMLSNALNGLADVAKIWQATRHTSANYSLDVGKTIIELFGLMSSNLQSISSSVAKMSTFEAS